MRMQLVSQLLVLCCLRLGHIDMIVQFLSRIRCCEITDSSTEKHLLRLANFKY